MMLGAARRQKRFTPCSKKILLPRGFQGGRGGEWLRICIKFPDFSAGKQAEGGGLAGHVIHSHSRLAPVNRKLYSCWAPAGFAASSCLFPAFAPVKIGFWVKLYCWYHFDDLDLMLRSQQQTRHSTRNKSNCESSVLSTSLALTDFKLCRVSFQYSRQQNHWHMYISNSVYERNQQTRELISTQNMERMDNNKDLSGLQ